MKRSISIFPILLCTILTFFLVACVSTEYSHYEGGKIKRGHGGTKKIVNGIDIWTYGTPPRKYKTIGIIDDVRDGGFSTRKDLYITVAKEVRKHGGDAAICIYSERAYYGYGPSSSIGVGGGYGYGYYPGMSVGVGLSSGDYNVISKFAVIRYIK